MVLKLDLKDRKILFELDRNSRASYAEIGKAVGLSKQVVKFRVERMINTGIIENFHAMWNISMLGYQQYNIYLRFKRISPEREKELIEALKKNKHTNWIVSVDGKWDLICATHFKTIQQFYEFMQGLVYKYGEIIKSRDIMCITYLFHFRRYYLINKRAEAVELSYLVEPREAVTLDKLDRGILKELIENARSPATEIATKVRASPEVVNKRIKRMVKNSLIQSFCMKMNFLKVGYHYYKIIVTLKNLAERRKKELVEFCAVHPNVTYVIEGIGIRDIHIDTEMESMEKMHEFILNLREKFPDILEDFEVLAISREHKMKYPLPE